MNIKNKTTLILILLLLSFNAVTFFKVQSTPIDDNTEHVIDLLAVGSQAKEWTLREIKTNISITFSQFSGKVVLLDFFLSRYEGNELALPHLRSVRSEYSASELVMITIAFDYIYEIESELVSFANSNGITWYMVIDTAEISNYYLVENAPTYFLINQNQRVAFAREGLTSDTTFINNIDVLLAMQVTTTTTPGQIPDFWQKNWYWFIIGGAFVIIFAAVIFQRQRVIQHNRKIRQERMNKRLKREKQKRN